MRKLCLTVVSGLAASAVAGLALAAQMNVQPGLWAETVQTRMQGSMIPPEELARMTPAQRARMEAAMQGAMADMQKPHMHQVCITPKELAEGFKPEERANCATTVTSSTGQMMRMHQVCNDEGARSVNELVIQASNPHAFTGQGHMTVSRRGGDMKGDMVIQGRWVSADCGKVR